MTNPAAKGNRAVSAYLSQEQSRASQKLAERASSDRYRCQSAVGADGVIRITVITMAANDTRPKPTKVRKESSEATSKRTEKSAATVQDSDDSEDIDQVNPNRPQESVDSSDDSDSDSSDDSEGDAVGPVKTAQKKGEKYA